jgi:hypothetical protein
MNAQLPKYMSLKDFCAYTGFSRYQFMRLAFKAGVVIKKIGPGHIEDRRTKIVDVAEALRAIEGLPETDKEVPVNLQEAPANAPADAAEETTDAAE